VVIMGDDSRFSVDRYAFDSIDRIRAANDQNVIVAELIRAMSTFGLNAMMLTGIPAVNDPLQPLVIVQNWPEAWSERYHACNYGPIDSALQRVHTTRDPFRWSDTRDPGNDRRRTLVLDEACEFGMCDGFVVPFRNAGELEAGVSFGTDKYMLTPREESAIHMISLYAFMGLRPSGPMRGIELSRRERECVKWLAAGKTAWEIGMILGLQELTVQQYLKTARQKTGAANGPHLVAVCIRQGLV
jgi:LuxR family quorum sensing-dependent transcriptional regulator